MIHICIADDEAASVERLRRFLDKFFRNEEGAYDLTAFADGEELVASYSPKYDIIFLDIEMPRLNGMAAAKRIRKSDSDAVIIFFTRMKQYAVKGYEVNALDFIVKPIDYPSFAVKMKKALVALSRRQEEKIEIAMNGNFVWVALSDVYYVEVIKHDLTYHTRTGIYTARGSLSALETSLREKGFRLCSRYCLINLKHVTGIYDWYVTVGTEKLEISRRKRKELMNDLLDYYGGVK